MPPTIARLRFDGANSTPEIISDEPLPGIVGYAFGNDPAKWHMNVPTYAGIIYRQLYPGVDLRYDGTSGQLRSTYTVAPGSDPTRIRWRYSGAQDVQVDAEGNLRVTLAPSQAGQGNMAPPATLIERAPIAWQELEGQHTPVTLRYAVAADDSISFALGTYDPTRPLIIDPTLSYSTYFGNVDYPDNFDGGNDITVDAAGNTYITGSTCIRSGGPAVASANFNAAFVAKLAPSGTEVYRRYFGSENGGSIGSGVAVDSAGNVYVTGTTGADDFCGTLSGYDSSFNGTDDVFVIKIGSSGEPLYCSYLGGSEIENSTDIAVAGMNMVYITGYTKLQFME
jgi:hypothetical protein